MNKEIVSILKKNEDLRNKMTLFLSLVVKFRKALYMRTLFLSLSALFLFSISGLKAQEKKVALGLSFSPTMNWMKTKSEGLSSDGSKFGFKYGLMADFNFGENYSFATGIFINNGGGKYNSIEGDTSSVSTVNYDHKIQSVEIPLTLRMRTKEIGYLKYYGQFGFSPQIIINSTADIQSDGGDSRNDIDMKDQVASFDLALVLGIGIEYNISGTTNLILGLSYHNGFIDMLKGSSYVSGDVEKNASSNQIALNLGVLF